MAVSNRKSPAFSFYVNDFIEATRDFSRTERAIYMDLLCYQWTRGPFDIRRASRYLFVEAEEQEAFDFVIAEKFQEQDGKYFNARLEQERDKQKSRSEAGKKAAKASVKSRQGNETSTNAQRTDQRNSSEQVNDSSTNESTKRQHSDSVSVSVSDSVLNTGSDSGEEDTLSAPSSGRLEYSPDFLEFWKEFPRTRRTKKREAYRKWKLVIREVEPGCLVERAAAYASSPLGRSEYAVMPSVWLNSGMWDDDESSWQRGGRSGKHDLDNDILKASDLDDE